MLESWCSKSWTILVLAHEGDWVWFSSGQPLKYSYWGSNHPNPSLGNTDDCVFMVVHSDTFWWEDCNCLTLDNQQRKIAPICQRDIAISTTTSTTKTTANPETTTTTDSETTSMDYVCDGYSNTFYGKHYFFSYTSHTWNYAEHCCNSLGGHLASVHSTAEGEFIYETSRIKLYWLGARDTGLEVIMS